MGRTDVKIRKQCEACPWKRSTRPERDIPGGYCAAKHAALKSTIARPGDVSEVGASGIRMMACHEFPVGSEQPCVGWTIHQLNEGNNLALRFLARDGRFSGYRTVGAQHRRLEDTLPKGER